MTDLKTPREPALPTIPSESEKDDFDRTTKFRKGNLAGLKDLQERVYDDLKALDEAIAALAAAQPNAHKTSHQSGGSDEISVTGLSGLLADDQHVLDSEVVIAAKTVKLDDFATPDDNTDLDFSTSRHGLCPKAPNNTAKFLRGDSTWDIPPGLITSEGEGHITIFPWFYSAIIQGTWVFSVDSNQIFYYYYYNSSNAQNDQLDFKVYLAAGTYTFKLLHVKDATFAIATLLINGVSKGTIDFVAGGWTYNQISSITNISITTSGIKTVSIKAATHTGSGWRLPMSAMTFFRTA